MPLLSGYFCIGFSPRFSRFFLLVPREVVSSFQGNKVQRIILSATRKNDNWSVIQCVVYKAEAILQSSSMTHQSVTDIFILPTYPKWTGPIICLDLFLGSLLSHQPSFSFSSHDRTGHLQNTIFCISISLLSVTDTTSICYLQQIYQQTT